MSVELMARLKALKLHGMAQCWPELMAKARHSDLPPEAWMNELLAAESAEREVRSIAYQMTAAKFPAHRDLAGFEFTQSRVDEALIQRLHGGEFIEAAHNIVFIGRTPGPKLEDGPSDPLDPGNVISELEIENPGDRSRPGNRGPGEPAPPGGPRHREPGGRASRPVRPAGAPRAACHLRGWR